MCRKSILVVMVVCTFALTAVSGPAWAEIIAQHLGATDPVTESWTRSSNGAGPVEGPVFNDGGYNAWNIDDVSSSKFLRYITTVTTEQIADAASKGWILSSWLRVVDTSDALDKAILVEYYDFDMQFGSDASGNAIVGLVGGSSYTTSSSGYHLYELKYDPVAGSADLFVDGTERISDYGGTGLPEPRIMWGSTSSAARGDGNYNLVKFEIIPEPSTITLLGIGLIGLLCYAWRKRR